MHESMRKTSILSMRDTHGSLPSTRLADGINQVWWASAVPHARANTPASTAPCIERVEVLFIASSWAAITV